MCPRAGSCFGEDKRDISLKAFSTDYDEIIIAIAASRLLTQAYEMPRLHRSGEWDARPPRLVSVHPVAWSRSPGAAAGFRGTLPGS